MDRKGTRHGWALTAALALTLLTGCGDTAPPPGDGGKGDGGATVAAVKLDTPQATVDALIKTLPTNNLDAIMKLYGGDQKTKMAAFREKNGDDAVKKMLSGVADDLKVAKPGEMKVDGNSAYTEYVKDAQTKIKISLIKEGAEWHISKVLVSQDMTKSSTTPEATPAAAPAPAVAPQPDAPK